jgi:hypothetical protein
MKMDIKKLAMEQQDFFSRLKLLQGTKITPKNFNEIESSINAFNKEKDETIAASYNRGTEANKIFKDTWEKFSNANGGDWAMAEFLPFKTAFDAKDLSGQEVYTQTLQDRAYGDEANLKYAEALQNAYSNPDGLTQDDRKEIMELAAMTAKINEALARMAKRYAEKLRDGASKAP